MYHRHTLVHLNGRLLMGFFIWQTRDVHQQSRK